MERRIPLHRGRFDQPRVQETFVWDMQQWPLPAGDSVQFYVEVYDNDTISGPKKGVSPTLTLKVRNREQEHETLEKLQEAVADTLLELLADHLELTEHVQEWREQVEVGKALDRAGSPKPRRSNVPPWNARTTGPATAGRLAGAT
jgi:hypothetical protein